MPQLCTAWSLKPVGKNKQDHLQFFYPAYTPQTHQQLIVTFQDKGLKGKALLYLAGTYILDCHWHSLCLQDGYN